MAKKNMGITSQDRRLLSECHEESFFRRSLPFSSLFGLITFGLSRTRKIPKTLLAIGAGYILGIVSYQEECRQKLMAVPTSKIGKELRKTLKDRDDREREREERERERKEKENEETENLEDNEINTEGLVEVMTKTAKRFPYFVR